MRNTHIGALIREKLKKEGRSVVWLAEKINCTPSNVYKIFGKSAINTEQLRAISDALDFDFFSCYCLTEEDK
ncbi:MAG: helix-turn-helix domain-containing protein [Bacteroidales bacterium]|jgi:hypothetical protein|nr:helix-turn-helix domain-containing protein [Bacteroidales bacterium]